MAEGKPNTMLRVFLILVLDLISFTVILPLLPAILDHYEAGSKDNSNPDTLLATTHKLMNWAKEALGMPNTRKYNNVLIGGFLGSMFSLLQFFANPVFGCLSDIVGRRKSLVLSMTGTALSYLIWLKSDSFTIFLVSRLVGGLCKGSVTICTTIMSDITTKENRAKGMAVVGIAFAVGFTIGPSLGAYFVMKQQAMSQYPALPFYGPAMFSLGLQLLCVLLVVLLLDETRELSGDVSLAERLRSASELANPCNLLKFCFTKTTDTVLCMKGQLTLIHFVYLLLFSGLEFTLTFLTHQRFDFSSKQQGMLFLYIGVVMMLVQGGCTRRVKHGHEKRLAIIGILSVIFSLLIVAISFSIYLLYFGLFLYSFGASTVIPCLTTMFSQYSAGADTGELMGVFRSAGALARAIGPIITCLLYWTFGSTICYLIGGLLFVVPLYMCMRLGSVEAKTN